MATTIGARDMSYLNTYFGAAATTTRQLTTNQLSPNYSINQLINATYGSNTASSNTFSLNDVLGKTFGMYTTTSRNVLHGSASSFLSNGTFIAYYGIGTTTAGTSGILNPNNLDFPINVNINVTSGDYLDITVQFYINGIWSTRTMTSSNQSWREELTGIRIIGFFPTLPVSLTLTSYPSIGNVNGYGRHQMTLSFEAEEPSSDSSSEGGGGGFFWP